MAKFTIAAAFIGSLILQTQAPTFEAASVKQNKSATGPQVARMLPGGRAEARNFSLNALIRIAYGTDAIQTLDQVVGGPAWIRTERWDIVAKANEDPGVAEPDLRTAVAAMLRALLKDRFHLQLHREMREVAVYALVRAGKDARLGPQLRASNSDFTMRALNGRIVATGATMAQLAASIANFQIIGRPVKDETGLSGKYDFELDYSGAGDSTAPIVASELESALFTSLPEQLGLKLQSERRPVEFVVVDRVDRPAED